MARSSPTGFLTARSPARPRRVVAVVVVTAAVAGLLLVLGVPSASLFAGLVVGVGFALAGYSPGRPPAPVFRAAQGTLGVLIGGLVQTATLRELDSTWFPVLVMTLATLALSIGGGLLLGRHPDVDPVTGSSALVAGGASGLVAMARDLGADERIVAVIQYLRVLVVTASMPLVLAVAGASGSGASDGSGGAASSGSWWGGLVLTAVAIAIGVPAAKLVHLPAGPLLGPLLVTTALTLAGPADGVAPPDVLVEVAYAVIGLQAGLTFDRESVRALRRILPWALGLIAAVIAACAGLGVLLAWWTGQSQLDGYLATTPGGLYAVLAAAVSGGADVTFVLSVQVLRVFVMLLGAPLLMKWIHRRLGARADEPDQAGKTA